AISWPAADYAVSTANGPSTMNPKSFQIQYQACADLGAGVWALRVMSIEGGASILIRTGGSRDPIQNPPTSQSEAAAAVADMQDYYTTGRGAWHTEAASRAHEEHHYREWRCSSENYWPMGEALLEQITVPYGNHSNSSDALIAIRGGSTGADAIAQQ